MKLDKALISTQEILRKGYDHKKVLYNRCGHIMEFHPKAQTEEKFCAVENTQAKPHERNAQKPFTWMVTLNSA